MKDWYCNITSLLIGKTLKLPLLFLIWSDCTFVVLAVGCPATCLTDTAAHSRRIRWTDDEESPELVVFLVVSLHGEADMAIILWGRMITTWACLAVGGVRLVLAEH